MQTPESELSHAERRLYSLEREAMRIDIEVKDVRAEIQTLWLDHREMRIDVKALDKKLSGIVGGTITAVVTLAYIIAHSHGWLP